MAAPAACEIGNGASESTCWPVDTGSGRLVLLFVSEGGILGCISLPPVSSARTIRTYHLRDSNEKGGRTHREPQAEMGPVVELLSRYHDP